MKICETHFDITRGVSLRTCKSCLVAPSDHTIEISSSKTLPTNPSTCSSSLDLMTNSVHHDIFTRIHGQNRGIITC